MHVHHAELDRELDQLVGPRLLGSDGQDLDPAISQLVQPAEQRRVRRDDPLRVVAARGPRLGRDEGPLEVQP